MIMRHDHPLHRKAITGGRSAPRAPLVEVAKVVLSGSAFGGQHVITVLAGEFGEKCDLLVDGRPIKARSYRRCMTAIMARVMRVAGITKKSSATLLTPLGSPDRVSSSWQ